MQKELESLDFPSGDAVRLYKDLAHQYLIARPTESEVMFRNAVKYINKTDNDNPEYIADKDWAPMRDYVAVTSDLLEIDEISITSSLNNVSSRRSRVRLKLGLLESSLKRFVDARKKLDEIKKTLKTLPKAAR